MTEQEREQILASLEQGRTALLQALQGVPEEMAARSPAPGSWSILGCVEHLVISEDYLFQQIVTSERSPSPLFNERREALMPVRGLDRSWRMESPPEGCPTGRFPTLSEAVRHFLVYRERTVQFVRDNREELRSRVTTHPIMGTVNCHEMLLSIAVHCLRHVKQIEEAKAALA
ncbi:MAG: DinB family protein [Terracidiphilus sp.]|jgi:hypothetical protein